MYISQFKTEVGKWTPITSWNSDVPTPKGMLFPTHSALPVWNLTGSVKSWLTLRTEGSESDHQQCPVAFILPLPTAQHLDGFGNGPTNNSTAMVVMADTHEEKTFFPYPRLILFEPSCQSLKKGMKNVRCGTWVQLLFLRREWELVN